MTQNLRDRIARLEGDWGPQFGFAERMEAARQRLRAMSPEAREAERRERYLQALNSEPPIDQLGLAMWKAARRMARHLALNSTPTQRGAAEVQELPSVDCIAIGTQSANSL